MAYIYAELDENNICKAVSNLSGGVIADTMIPLDSYDISLLGKRYNNGEWLEVEQPEIEPQPSQLDRIESAVNDIAKNNIVTEYERNFSAKGFNICSAHVKFTKKENEDNAE